MSSGQKSKQRRVIQRIHRRSASAPRSKEKPIWTEGKMNSGQVSSPKFLLVEAAVCCA